MSWKKWGGVPIDDNTREVWIQDCIERLKKNPNQYSTWTSSGDTKIVVSRTGTPGRYEVRDCRIIHHKIVVNNNASNSFDPRRSVEEIYNDLIAEAKGDLEHPCVCDLNVIMRSGCECGGV